METTVAESFSIKLYVQMHSKETNVYFVLSSAFSKYYVQMHFNNLFRTLEDPASMYMDIILTLYNFYYFVFLPKAQISK